MASAAARGSRFTCSGSAKQPGVLAGTYADVVVRGMCVVNSGAAHVQRDSSSSVGGNLIARHPLGIVVHASTIGANVIERGDGGVSCTPKGIFAAFKSPVYSGYEDNWVGGNLSVTGLRSR